MSGTYHASSDSSGPQQETDAADHPADHLDAPEGLRGEVAHLQEAVKSQRDIGMAIGLLSARFGCSTEQAWRTMQRVSQNSNVKVRTVAHVLVTTHDGSAQA